MASTAVGTHAGAGPLSLMSCVRESSPQESVADFESDKTVASKKRFWNPRKWFKRKANKVSEDSAPPPETPDSTAKESLRRRSTSEISETDEQPVKRRSGTPMHPGLSVSHDSIFHSPNSGSELDLEEAQSSSSLSIQHHPTQTELRLQTELSERLRLRRGRGDTSEDDEGLPRSPCCNSPTTTEGLNEKTAIKNHPTKSHSTCSDGSLLSMGSSEIEDDSFGHQSSRHSSKLSLYEKKTDQETDWDLEPGSISAPLNHSAAHHRVAVRPKRTHGAPRRKRVQPLTGNALLPTTPEVNEDLPARSLTPETSTKETVTELFSSSSSMSKTRTENQLKCSSLPPGLAAPGNENSKLNRSQSSAGSKSQDTFSTLGEEDEDKDEKKSDQSIFSRLFPRRSGKKKKAKQEQITNTADINKSSDRSNAGKPAPRSGPASRQRVQPIDIPATPDVIRRELENFTTPKDAIPNVSPLQLELENHFRQKMTSATSPPRLQEINTTNSISSISQSFWSESVQHTKVSSNVKYSETKIEDKKYKFANTEESRNKIKIAGLSSLQQRVLQHDQVEDDVVDNIFKSLTDFTSEERTNNNVIMKSHSFKTKQDELKDATYYISSIISKNDIMEKKSFVVERKIKNSEMDDAIDGQEESKNIIKCESSESLESESSTKTSSTEYLDSLNPINSITISGPSHTSVVSVSTPHDAQIADNSIKPQPDVHETFSKDDQTVKEHQVSVTKIQVKRESVQVTQNNSSVPEFLNVHLNKVDAKPATNIVLTANVAKQDANNEMSIPNADPTTKQEMLRKFSQDDIEVIDKEINEEIVEIPSKNILSPSPPNVIVTSMAPPNSTRIYKKHSELLPQYSHMRKSSLVSVGTDSKAKISLRTKSNSLDIVDSLKHNGDILSQSNLDKTFNSKQKVSSTTNLQESVSADSVILRRKSITKQKQDEEPELMKVFARRSLKLKDSDDIAQQVLVMMEDTKNKGNSNGLVNKSRDSDKENHLDSPPEERKKSITKEQEKPKEPLAETKFVETTEVTLRKPINNKLFTYQQRTVSLNIPKTNEIINTEKVQKNHSFSERAKTEISEKITNMSWISTVKKESDIKEDIIKIACDEVITDISPKCDFINEDFPTIPKNFNQRKAEWEKRAQEALKKNVP